MRDYKKLLQGILRHKMTAEEVYASDGGKADSLEDAFRDLQDITVLMDAPGYLIRDFLSTFPEN